MDFLLRGGQEPQPGAGPGGMPFEGGIPGGHGIFGGMPGGGRSFHYSTNGGSGGFSFSNPESIFADFFKQGGANMGDDDDIFAAFRGNGARSSGGRGRSYRDSNGGTKHRRAPTPEVTTIEKQLPVTLEELFKGAHKRMKIKRKTFDMETNKRKDDDKILEMDIKPGYKAGTKIKFKGVGDQEEGGTQDLHFIVTEVSISSLLRSFDPADAYDSSANIRRRKSIGYSNVKMTISA